MADRMNENYLLVSIGANTRCLVKFCAVDIWAVVEGSVPLPHWSSSSLIHKMPVETSEGSMLCAFVLKEKRTLLSSELF